MTGNYHTLRFLVSTLKPMLPGSRVETIFTQERDQVVVQFSHPERFLILSCDPQLNALYLHPRFSRARKNTVDILNPARGTLTDLFVHPADRVVSFRFSSGIDLQARMFGREAHIVIVDTSGAIIDTFRTAAHTARPLGQPHAENDLRNLLPAMPDRRLTDLIKSTRPTWGPLVLRETLHRCGIDGSLIIHSLNGEQLGALENTVADIGRELDHPTARVYVHPHGPSRRLPVFSIIPLRHVEGMEERTFDDPHEAVRFFVSHVRSGKFLDEQKDGLVGRIRDLARKSERSLAATEKDLAEAGRADEYERFGRLLMNNLHAVRKGDESVALQDEALTVKIPLQPHLSPVQNGQRFFEKAKKTRIAHQQATLRSSELRARCSLLNRLLDGLTGIESKEDLREFLSAHSADLSTLGLTQRQQEVEKLPFRTFVVEGGFEVWAGKNSKSNDELTLHHARPEDLWFHARGSGGSHVVLRVKTGKGEPGKRALTQAASIAAYFSKMKNAKIVPVAMTRRKYVRKPRKAPPGTVAIEREEVLFAEPKLPEQ